MIDAHSSATAVITPIVELNKSNREKQSRICASGIKKLKHKILSLDEPSSSIKSSEYLELMEVVKKTVERSFQLSLLTLAPASCTHKKISVRLVLVKILLFRLLRKKTAILAKPEAKTSSRRLTDDDKQRVVDFYISDEYSRKLPGMNSVKNEKQPNGKRILLLILDNDELKIKIITFFSLFFLLFKNE